MNFLTKNPKATMAEIREIAQTEGMRQASALNQQVAYLADIGTIAPMVGLLGTVIGIVRSFGVIAIDAAATRPTMLAQGIGEAHRHRCRSSYRYPGDGRLFLFSRPGSLSNF